MEEEFWGRKLLQLMRKINQRWDKGLSISDFEFEDFLNKEDEEEKEDGPGEEALQEKRQKEIGRLETKLNAVASRREIPKRKVKRIFVKKATAGSRKEQSQPRTMKKEKLKSHSQAGNMRSNKKEREQRRNNQWWEELSKERFQEYKDFYNGWPLQKIDQREWCYKRRRLKTSITGKGLI